MWGPLARSVARFLALAALATQTLMPGAVAAASARSPDAAAILCAMPGMGSPAADPSLGAELAELISSKSKPDPQDQQHNCSACTLAQTAALPAPVILKQPSVSEAAQTAPLYEVRFAHVPRGPPVGSRAPPVFRG